MKFKFILGIGLTVASLHLNAQVSPINAARNNKVNKKYLKHVREIINSYQKSVAYAKEHTKNHLTSTSCTIISQPWTPKPARYETKIM